ncbi:HyaD/HybD family hydrogenase maturation endopeptidase [Ectobacillus ponti]|uniref:HyaD/HybD family hydrogenase maturation endopeptidase n=1 Tax=Ectobacillus ponti TaxID=2961894 RepID=A0AA42BQJ4_9BACI|nr:HyaD/HybD family hydrogenase maturation endopeptidase [Ectobacillus ponti]MCP8970360.1 HyaD/HybD family hydrogenase maturation endopeptidase [Ectobacillus ponti]
MTSKHITVLGIGNLLYSDEGVGVQVLPQIEKRLARLPVDIVEGSTDGMRLLSVIEESDYLVIIDAMNAGMKPGTIVRIEGEEIPSYFGVKMSIHQLGFQEVLFAARLLEQLPKQMVMYGVQPDSLEFGLELSPIVQGTLPRLAACVEEEVQQWLKNS